MKLTGSLANVPLDEMLLLIMQRSGTVTIWDLPDNQGLQLHIGEGRLKAFFVNYRPLDNETQIVRWIAQLLKSEMGIFSFDPKPLETLEDSLDTDINKLLLNAAVMLDQTKQVVGKTDQMMTLTQAEHHLRELRHELKQQVDEFWRSASGVRGIAVSARGKPLRVGDVQRVADLATRNNTNSVQRNAFASPHGDINEVIIDTADDILMTYRFKTQKALFVVTQVEDKLQRKIRNLVIDVVEFWVKASEVG
jgi:hypothetical protein